MKSRYTICLLLVGGVVHGPVRAQTGSSLVHTTETIVPSTVLTIPGTLLDRFTATTAVGNIDAIGLYNIGANPQNVDIYKNGSLLQSVAAAGGAGGYVWKYTAVTPFSVVAGDLVELFYKVGGATGTSNGYNDTGAAGTNTSSTTFGLGGSFVATQKYTGTTADTYASVLAGGSNWTTTSSTLGRMSGGGSGGAVPEPGEWAAMGILGAGLTGLVIRKRRKG
jgi:hypothetical protein